jgi:hypothetical protein
MGKEILRLLEEKRMSPTTLCKKIGMQERSIYDVFRRSYLNSELLQRVSKALETNLFLHYINPEDLPTNPELQAKIDELNEQNFALKKELDYLKEINQLLREKK